MTARSPYLMSGLGHVLVLGTFLTVATLQPAPRIVPGIKIVAVSGRARSSASPGIPTRQQVQAEPKREPRPEPPAPPVKPQPKPVDKAPPTREAAKAPDPKGVKAAKKPEIVSKTPAKAPDRPATAPATSTAQSGSGSTSAAAGSGGVSKGGIGFEAEGEAGLASAYLALLRDKVASNWVPPAAVGRTGEMRAVVYFTIARTGGEPLDVTVQQSSGDGSFDRAAMRAVMDARPLQPLPQQWPDESIAIRFTFFQTY